MYWKHAAHPPKNPVTCITVIAKQSWNKQQENNNTPTGLSWDTSLSNWPFFFLFLNLIQWYPLTKNSYKTKICSHQMILAWYTIKYTGVALIANFCINIGFSGAVHILAALPYGKWLNTGSASYGSLAAAASLNTRSICKLHVISAVAPPQHLKSSQWRAEYGRRNKYASCHYFGLYGNTPSPPPPPKKKSDLLCTLWSVAPSVCE